ncbi:hydroxymethylglutaryl-CoA lyase [Sulfurospirillum arcachonense]|uniref:hydroxymethylglutaryl-CoA lyase n=1 Tax=Sulfurospirillum arcachonense TaxID=57666 RepID=UPI000468DD42|nr:hydroxymethylglutaryl-CoA lyase [Sulfurospirillum arcachonense]
MNFPKTVKICEVGPRDGLQNEKKLLSTEQKIELVNGVLASGISSIEIGSFVHPKAIPQMADTEKVMQAIGKRKNVEFRALITNLKGVERAIDAGVDKVKLTVSASKSHNLSNFNCTPEQSVASFDECVKVALEAGLEVSGAISTTFGCPFEGKIPLKQITKLIESFRDIGIKEISLSDTTGVANPRQVYDQLNTLKKHYKDVIFHLHFHNTRGQALANIIAGMQAGVTHFDGSFAGLGGCPYAPGASGNIATEDIVHMLEDMNIDTGINLDALLCIAKKAQEFVGHETDSAILRAGKSSELIPNKPKKQIIL